MRKSDATQIIATQLILDMLDTGVDVPFDVAQKIGANVLEKLCAAGITPPQRDYIEHYAFKTDRTWEKEV